MRIANSDPKAVPVQPEDASDLSCEPAGSWISELTRLLNVEEGSLDRG